MKAIKHTIPPKKGKKECNHMIAHNMRRHRYGQMHLISLPTTYTDAYTDTDTDTTTYYSSRHSQTMSVPSALLQCNELQYTTHSLLQHSPRHSLWSHSAFITPQYTTPWLDQFSYSSTTLYRSLYHLTVYPSLMTSLLHIEAGDYTIGIE
jgi:hypothetical protein